MCLFSKRKKKMEMPNKGKYHFFLIKNFWVCFLVFDFLGFYFVFEFSGFVFLFKMNPYLNLCIFYFVKIDKLNFKSHMM